MSNTEKYIGNAPIKSTPDNKYSFIIKDGTVTTAKIASEAVTSAKIASNAVTSSKIASSAVTEEKIGDNAVSSSKIQTLSINSGHLQNSAVTTDKISNGAVTENKIADGSVTGSKIADNVISSEKIIEGAVTSDKIAEDAVEGIHIKAGVVTSEKLSAEIQAILNSALTSVNTSNIADNAITSVKIANGAVTSSKIPYKAITKNHLSQNLQDTLNSLDITAVQSYTEAQKEQIRNNIDTLSKAINIAYSNLVTLRNNSELIPGQKYRITDYVTTTTQEDTYSANHAFDIVVEAMSENTLSETALAVQHSGDTYFNDAELSAWSLKYCLDNDTNRFMWADTDNGKGVIYELIDEFNNRCGYDFKNILFTRYKISNTINSGLSNRYAGVRTVSASNNGEYIYSVGDTVSQSDTIRSFTFDANGEDGSLNIGCNCSENKIGNYYIYINNTQKQYLNNIAFVSSTSSVDTCNNTIEGNCHSMTFGDSCEANTIGKGCYNNIIGDGCFYNVLEEQCHHNSICSGSNYNNIKKNATYCVLKAGCEYNTIGNCTGVTIGPWSSYCSIEHTIPYNNSEYAVITIPSFSYGEKHVSFRHYIIVSNNSRKFNLYLCSPMDIDVTVQMTVVSGTSTVASLNQTYALKANVPYTVVQSIDASLTDITHTMLFRYTINGNTITVTDNF